MSDAWKKSIIGNKSIVICEVYLFRQQSMCSHVGGDPVCLGAIRGLGEKGCLFFLCPDTGGDDKMSTTDKAQQKLVDSIRKTRAGSAETPQSAKKPTLTRPPSSRSGRKVSATKAAKSGPRRGTAITGRAVPIPTRRARAYGQTKPIDI